MFIGEQTLGKMIRE